jgi:hypothetical protein
VTERDLALNIRQVAGGNPDDISQNQDPMGLWFRGVFLYNESDPCLSDGGFLIDKPNNAI